MRVVEWVLRGLAVVSLATSLVWILGWMGTGLIYESEPLRDAAHRFDLQAAAGSPAVDVVPGPDVIDELLASGLTVTPSDGSGPGNYAEISVAFLVTVYDPSGAQRLVYVALQSGLALGIAWLWWTLARMVADGRRGDPFTPRNAARLTVLGLLIGVGAPAYAVASWLVGRWLVTTSELAERVSAVPFGWRDLPWFAVGAGLALLVLAAVWRRGAAMRHDLAGLV